jgi:hypothetical protein
MKSGLSLGYDLGSLAVLIIGVAHRFIVRVELGLKFQSNLYACWLF